MAQSERLKVKGRLCFPNLFEPHPQSGKFNAIVADIDPPTARLLEDETKRLMQEQWSGKVNDVRQLKQFFLHDGAEKSQYEGFEAGVPYISASNTVQPTVVDRHRMPVTKASGIIYAGCYVVAYINLWTQDNEYGKGVNASLSGVQFLLDGPPLSGGRPLDPEEFDEYEDEDDPQDGLFG